MKSISLKAVVATVVISLFLILFTALPFTFAGDSTWIYQYTTPDKNIVYNDAIKTSDGGFLAVGKVIDTVPDNTDWDPFFCKLNTDGTVQWKRKFCFPGKWNEELYSVVECPTGGYIAVGTIAKDGVDGCGRPAATSAVAFIKLNHDGSFAWSRLLKNYDTSGSFACRIRITQDGNYIMVGSKTAYSYSNLSKCYSTITGGALIVKIDGNGGVLFGQTVYGDWQHSYSWVFYDVAQDSNGAYYAVGRAGVEPYSSGVGGGGLLLAKFSSAGELEWAHKYDYSINEEIQYIGDVGHRIVCVNDTLYVAGILETGQNWLSNPFTLSSFSLSGKRNWTKQYFGNFADNGTSGVSDLIVSGDGNLYLTTAQRGYSVNKIDLTGQVLWCRTLGGQSAPFLYLSPNSLFLDQDNGIIIAGSSYDSSNGSRSYLYKFDKLGQTCSENACNSGDYSVADVVMANNNLSYNVISVSASQDVVPSYAGPAVTVEKMCGAASQMSVYMPHLTGVADVSQQAAWSDNLEVDNYSDKNCKFTVVLYDENGDELYSGEQSIDALSEKVINLKNLAGNARCGKIVYDNPKINFRLAFKNSSGGGVAEFKLDDRLEDKLGFYFSDFTSAIAWKGMALCNWGATSATISLKAQGAGVEYPGPSLTVGARQKIVGVFSSWFPQLDFSQVKRILVTSDTPTIDGVTISGDGSSSLLLFTAAAPLN